MPTEKLTRILLAKSPFSPKQIAEMTEGDGWRWVYKDAEPRKEKQFEVCFTGFSASEKGSLSQLAVDAGFMVVTAVTRNLSMLCIGPNAGPAKLEKAKQQHTTIVTLEQFKHFMATGEVPRYEEQR
jgi:BRCT domain type II-containing protein